MSVVQKLVYYIEKKFYFLTENLIAEVVLIMRASRKNNPRDDLNGALLLDQSFFRFWKVSMNKFWHIIAVSRQALATIILLLFEWDLVKLVYLVNGRRVSLMQMYPLLEMSSSTQDHQNSTRNY
jgi:hypothetical protein